MKSKIIFRLSALSLVVVYQSVIMLLSAVSNNFKATIAYVFILNFETLSGFLRMQSKGKYFFILILYRE